ncbi:FK506-binding protein 2, partial [Linum grandiflorum]
HYRENSLTGTVFDSSFERGDPIDFELGSGQVIKGSDQGLVGMCVDKKRKLKIPAKLGYGDQGSPPTIPGTLFVPYHPMGFVYTRSRSCSQLEMSCVCINFSY